MFYTVHPKSRELLTVALALTALASTLSQEKSVPRCLLDSLWGKMREAARPAFQDLSVGAESHRPDLAASALPGR